MIREGKALIDTIYAARHLPAAYQIQAAISALHCVAPTAEDTDWAQIVALYEKLEEYDPSPVIPVNRAVALSLWGRDQEALDVLDDQTLQTKLREYQPYFAALGHVYQELGMADQAREALRRALELAQSPPQKRYIERCLQELN